MNDILKCQDELNFKTINFWYRIGNQIQQRVKGSVQVLFNKIDNSIVIKIFFDKINYSISTDFPLWKQFEERDVINMILDGIKYNIYEKIFK